MFVGVDANAAGLRRVSEKAVRAGLANARSLGATELARWPSTWARRLARGRDRTFWQIDTRAARVDDSWP